MNLIDRIATATHAQLDALKSEHNLYEPVTGRGALLFPQLRYRRIHLTKAAERKIARAQRITSCNA